MPILVVDDSRAMARIIEALLRQAGFTNVELAHDVASALEHLHSKRFSLVMSDWCSRRVVSSCYGAWHVALPLLTGEKRNRSLTHRRLTHVAAGGRMVAAGDGGECTRKPNESRIL